MRIYAHDIADDAHAVDAAIEAQPTAAAKEGPEADAAVTTTRRTTGIDQSYSECSRRRCVGFRVIKQQKNRDVPTRTSQY